jgi:hypothetical protein
MRLTECAALMGILAAPVISAEPLTMTIRVLDQAKVSTSKISKMESNVDATLASVDIGVSWIDCAANLNVCKALRGPNEFWLRVLAQNPPDLGTGTELLGLTQRGDKPGEIPVINIFYPLVEKLAEKMHIEAHLVFGAAVTHEIGHMYLGNNREAHSLNGVMCGVWTQREFELMSIGELHFTRDQGERIRAAMSLALARR